jgi:hypothetical protein
MTLAINAGSRFLGIPSRACTANPQVIAMI